MDANSQSGVTLIELLLTLSVAAILISLATPSFAELGARNRITAASTGLASAVQFARHRAVTAAERVVLCPSRDGAQCDASNHWEHGWIVRFEDAAGRAPLLVQDALPAGTIAVSSAGRNRLRYRADGSAPGTNLSIVVCRVGHADDARALVVSNSGRPRRARASAAQAQQCATP